MPPPTWRDLARKAAQVLKRQLAQTERGLASLLNPGRTPQAIPVPLPQRRAPRFPGDKRYYSQPASLRRASAPRSSGVASLVKTEFGRTCLRPRLSNGTLRLHGYGRNFTTGPVNHADVAREVYRSISQGIRAGVLNTPFYPPPTSGKHRPGQVLCRLQSGPAVRTHLEIPLCPVIALPTTGTLTGAAVSELEAAIAQLPHFLTRLRRDLRRLSNAGEFEYTLCPDDARIRITFHDRSRTEVEAFLADLNVVPVSLEEEILGFDKKEESVDWGETLSPAARRAVLLRRDDVDIDIVDDDTHSSLDRFIASVDRERRARMVK